MKGISSLELVFASSIYIIGIFFFIQIISSDVVSYEREIDREVGRSVAAVWLMKPKQSSS